ncbi:HEBP2-like protein, partial [Mya arenaria]
EYEEREYAATEWVSTQQTNMDYEKASYTMFERLFKYIKGANEKKKPIKMTCPVVNRIIPGAGPACESNFTMSFFVAPIQKPAPAPTDPSVFLNNAPRFTAYVRQFSGYAMTYDVWRDQAVALAKALKVDGVEFRTDMYWTAGYDSPFELFNRHNEVWFLGKNENLSL